MSTIATVERPRSGRPELTFILTSEMSRAAMHALADDFSSRIMGSTTEEPRTAEEVSGRQGIPLSTCYRRIRTLVDAGLLVVERIVITSSGKRYALYRSCFRSFRVSSDLSGLLVEAEMNEDVAEKVRARKLSLIYGNHDGGQES